MSDLINRQDAIAIFGKLTLGKYYTALLKTIPSAEPERKTGKWIEYTRVIIPEPINQWEQAWFCSECGYGNQECEDGSAWLEWKYCPNCGARMEE